MTESTIPAQPRVEAPAASPSPAASAEPAVPADRAADWLGWWPALAAAAGLILAVLLLLLRRRRGTPDAVEPLLPAAPVDAPAVLPIAPVSPRIEVDFTPVKAGLTAIELVVEFEVHVRNAGAAPIADILASVHLLTASARQDIEIAGIAAEPGDPANHNPFNLPAGADRVLKARLVLPRGMVRPAEVRGRLLAVPIVVIDLRWGADQLVEAFVVGRALAGSDRLGPFFLDRPPGLSAEVAARRHDWRAGAASQ